MRNAGCWLAVMAVSVVAGWGGRCAWGAAAKTYELSGAKGMMGERAATLEKEVAARMMKRPDTPSDQAERLEVEIDLRIVARWMWGQALLSPGGSEQQAAARLRGQLCQEATAAIEDVLAKQGGRLTPMQKDAVGRLHQLTFALGVAKTGKDVDEVSRRLGVIVLAFGAGGNEKAIVWARPRPARAHAPAPAPQRNGPMTAGQMAEEARRLNVSVGLRQQLLALAAAASGPKTSEEAAKEVATLWQMLGEALELAKGLQSNTAVGAEARVQMEGQLAEGLALFIDPRTRASGTAKIAAMHQYGQITARINRLELTAEQMAQLGPMFVWAREHGEQGNKAMAALEREVVYRAHVDARARQANMMPTLRRSIEELEKQFAQTNTAFVAAAADLPRTGNPAELEVRADEMRRIIDLLDRLDQMPVTLDALGAYKPRPAGGLERRVVTAAAASASVLSSPGRTEAMRLIDDVHQLAKMAGELSKMRTSDIPMALEKRWTGGRLAAVEAKWKQTVTELASAAAGGGEMDGRKMGRLPAAMGLVESLRRATEMDMGLAMGAGALTKWVDWRMSLEDLKAILAPYPGAMAEAFAGYVGDSATWENRWAKVEKEYRPLTAMINRAGAYREQCEAFPAGIAGLAAGLMTPMEGAPFATERYVGFAAAVWKWCAETGDATGAKEAMAALLRRAGE